jgi:glucose/arabinose dehydrogenase
VKNKIIAILLMLTSFLWSEYNIENAYPNLNFDNPVGIYHSGDNTNRIFILEQEGIIKVFNNDASATNVEIFLDITSIVDQDGGYTEEGLLGLAFHPNYNENGYFFVNYTSHNPRRNVIARYNVSANNPNQADEESSVIILEVNQPYTNHNGGQLSFGPDAYLYIIFGDGGSAGDPHNNGQNLTTLLGSLIRIDVDNPTGELNYGIPPDNPFIAPLAARDEIYAYGLRNMWRFSWDFETGLLWGADVGQNAYEEIDIIYSGLNYGWNTMEGNHCFPIGSDCNTEGLELPIWEYELYVNDVCSITGGYVYRGNDLNGLIGKYIYGDWCTGDIWALTYESDNNIINQHLLTTGINITTFGLDQFNELLFCGGNQIFKITSDFGDLNDDSTINVLDIIILVNHILNPATIELDGSDINDDGEVNILDIVHLVSIILN